MSRRALALAAALLAGVACAAWAAAAGARVRQPRPRAPVAPPLTSATTPALAPAEGGSAEALAPVDPLVANGLGSPLCEGRLGAEELPPAARRRCASSGFTAAAAPTGDYGLDVHIETGPLSFGADLLSAVQTMLVAPVWMVLVWSLHALVVMIEWAFTIDLLDGDATGLGASLRRLQAAVTAPWLAAALALAAVLVAYRGLVRRHALAATGEVAAMAAMMAGGLWLIADPAGTAGALATWADRAGLGTLALATSGSPGGGGRALAASMATVFTAGVEAPWCYLEFGDVGWCREPGRLDPRLRAAALRIASTRIAQARCQAREAWCAGERATLKHSAQLLREANTNGAVFLALPANGPDRNALATQGSLLRVLCGGAPVAGECRGPTAAQAEFRAAGGTWARVGGLLLIVTGLSGMLLLLGFIAVRLLAAAVLSLLCVLIAPAMVLAPALGEAGRAAFRGWAGQLLGALVAKLVFAFLLGVVLAAAAVLAGLDALGWWTQWLLSASFWWCAFARRHALLGPATGVAARPGPARALGRFRHLAPSPRRALLALRRSRERERAIADAARNRGDAERPLTPVRGEPAREDGQAVSLLDARSDEAAQVLATSAARETEAVALQGRLERIRAAHADALAAGDGRRATRLRQRAEDVESRLQDSRRRLAQARATIAAQAPTTATAQAPATAPAQAPAAAFAQAHEDVHRRRSRVYGQVEFLTEQARRPGALAAARSRARKGRDYAALAPLLGYSAADYERLDPGTRRVLRLALDRELAARHVAPEPSGPPPRIERPEPPRAPVGDSPVMRDALEVMAGRKKHFGEGLP